jgi:hypothetical protein
LQSGGREQGISLRSQMLHLHKLSLVRCVSAGLQAQPNWNYRKTRQNRQGLTSFTSYAKLAAISGVDRTRGKF